MAPTTTLKRSRGIAALLVVLAPACGIPEFDVRITDGSPPTIHWDEQAMNSLTVTECEYGCEDGACTSFGGAATNVEVWSIAVGRDGQGYFASPRPYGEPPPGSDAWPPAVTYANGAQALPLKATAHYSVMVELMERIDASSWRPVTKGAACFTGIDYAVDTTAACRSKDACKRFGYCTSREFRCVVGSDADCQQSTRCTYFGECKMNLSGSACEPGSDVDCQQAVNCKSAGWCTKLYGICGAGSDADCQQSTHCKDTGKCTAQAGLCV